MTDKERKRRNTNVATLGLVGAGLGSYLGYGGGNYLARRAMGNNDELQQLLNQKDIMVKTQIRNLVKQPKQTFRQKLMGLFGKAPKQGLDPLEALKSAYCQASTAFDPEINALTKKISRPRRIGGALAGAALLGGVGAISGWRNKDAYTDKGIYESFNKARDRALRD